MTSPDPTTTIASEIGAPNIAVDIQPDYERGTFLFDESEWDSPDLLAWGDASDGWQNIICDVTSVAITRGATRSQGVLTRTEAGTCALTLTDTERRFDPMVNFDAIHAGTPIRIRVWGSTGLLGVTMDGGSPTSSATDTEDGGTPTLAATEALTGGATETYLDWSEVMFTGRIGAGHEGVSVQYPKTGAPQVTILAVDRVTPLAGWKAAGHPDPGVGGGDNLAQRVGRVLDELSWSRDIIASDVDTAFEATLAPNTLAAAWPVITDAVDAELGRLWVDRDDKIVIRSRDSQLSGPVRGTLSDVHDEIVAGAVHCCYDAAQVVYGTELLANRAIAGRRIPRTDDSSGIPVTIAQVDDEYSQARYGLSAVEERGLELELDGQLLPWAEALILGQTEPELRVNSVSVAPRNASDAWPAVAATDIGDRWSFRLTPELGPRVARTLGVLGIAHTITPRGWDVEWITENAPTPGDDNPSGWFTLDLSEWDSEDLMAPIGGAVSTP